MKTVEDMIAKQMSVINLNMIQTIQNTLIRQPSQYTTQENQSQSLTQLSTSANTNTTTTTTIENQYSNESTTLNSHGNAKRKHNDQLCPEATQDTIPGDNNNTVMEYHNSINLHNQRNQTILSPPHRREIIKKSSSDS